MEKVGWTDRVRDEVVLHRVKEDRNILHSEKKEGEMDWSHLVWELPSKGGYGMRDRGKAKSDGNTRMKA